MAFDFTGKRVVVTGAGQGIGRGIVESLVKAGAQVVAVSRTKENLDRLAAELPGIETIAVDLGDWDATRAALSGIGPVDGLVNNAGVARGEPLLKITKNRLDEIIHTNLYGTIHVSQIIAQGMVERNKGGSIVNMSSVAAQKAQAGLLAYSASKAAIDQATKVMALELGKHNIRVNCINPTAVLTAMTQQKGWIEVKGEPILAQTPLARFAEIQEVADATLFLLSDKSTMISGVTLPVDGAFLVT